jgi:hypothetical protein
MHRNTIIVVAFLATFSALVVGVNIGKKFNPETKPVKTVVNPEIKSTTPPTIMPTPTKLLYEDPICGIAFAYPKTLTKVENPSGGTMFIDINNPNNTLFYNCNKSMVRPNLPDENISNINIGTLSAKIYQDNSQSEDKPMNKLIFHLPTKNFDIQISGLGDGFNIATASVRLQ